MATVAKFSRARVANQAPAEGFMGKELAAGTVLSFVSFKPDLKGNPDGSFRDQVVYAIEGINSNIPLAEMHRMTVSEGSEPVMTFGQEKGDEASLIFADVITITKSETRNGSDGKSVWVARAYKQYERGMFSNKTPTEIGALMDELKQGGLLSEAELTAKGIHPHKNLTVKAVYTV
jgi:hypothetical protein